MIVIIYGNIIDGSHIIGPFKDFDEANSFAERKLKDDDWHSVKLVRPRDVK